MNTTAGPTRRGNRTGRPVYTLGTETTKVTVTLDKRDLAMAKRIGAGKATRGLRRAIHAFAVLNGEAL